MKYHLRIQGFMLRAAEQTKDFIKQDILNYVFMLKCGFSFILLPVLIGLYICFG